MAAPPRRFDVAFAPEKPWPVPALGDCSFYHCTDFPDGTSVDNAQWDIRGGFDQYVGNYPLSGKTVLDVGTASGFLAFGAEDAGALQVTGLDAAHASEYELIPFRGKPFTDTRLAWVAGAEHGLKGLKNSFWYTWHKRNSRVEAIYAPLNALPAWDRTFDVVIAGAIIEHISDPVPFIASLARLAREAVVLAFTPYVATDEQVMTTMNDWSDPAHDVTWWMLSYGLYRRIFENMGFRITTASAVARTNLWNPPLDVRRPTIVAIRN